MATECWGRHCAVTNRAMIGKSVATCCHPRMYWGQQPPQRHGPARSNPRRVFISIQPGSGVNAPLGTNSKRGLPGSELCARDGAAHNIAVHNNVNCERATRRYLVVPHPHTPRFGRMTRLVKAIIASATCPPVNEKESCMARPRGQSTYSKLALLLLVCAVVLGGTLVLNRSHFYSGPRAGEIPPVGNTSELPPVW